MSARVPSASGSLAGSPASIADEPASSRKSPAALLANNGSPPVLPTPGKPPCTQVYVATADVPAL